MQWEEVGRAEEKLRQKKTQRRPCILGLFKARTRGLTDFDQRKRVRRKREKREKVVRWSTKELDEQVSTSWVTDTEEMVRWRSFRQEEIDESWRRIAGKVQG